MTHHVIVGAGPAGVVAAEQIRKLEPDARITLIGDEPEPPYSRMALPYYLVDNIPEEGTWLRKQEGHYERLGIDLEQARVTAVDPSAHRVTLESGATLDYDRLLLATGSHPVAPPIPGVDSPGVFPCWTLADAREIAARCKPGAKVVLMGAGFIGCIILEALALKGTELTVVEMGDRMVPRMLDETAGNLLKSWCEGKGVRVLTGTRVTAIEPAGGRLRAVLSTGEALDADLVVSATGVAPNTAFLEGSGIEVRTGIVIDRHMQTSQADVYAAGDVAEGRDFSTGEYTVQAIQPTATEHAVLAARNMTGHRVAHRGSVNMNVLDTLGLISVSFAEWQGVDGGDSVSLLNAGRYRYINLQFADDVLVGATALGLTDHVGVIRGLIQTRVRLGEWKERLKADPTRLMEAYLARVEPIGANAGLIDAH